MEAGFYESFQLINLYRMKSGNMFFVYHVKSKLRAKEEAFG